MAAPTAEELDLLDRKICNHLQGSFPMVAQPFAAIAEALGTDEEDVLRRITRLKRLNVIRQISAIFDTRKLGYKSTLVAMRFAPEDLLRGAHAVNEHPGVSHNYERDHPYNLWFTIAVPPDRDLEATVRRLGEQAGAQATLLLPTLRLFKIGVNFDMVSGEGASTDAVAVRPTGGLTTLDPPNEQEIAFIRALQQDLPLESRPFRRAAEALGTSEDEVLAIAERMRQRGQLRRVAAVLHHRRAGFRANGMGVWIVPEDRVEELGPVMGAFPQVSHCYRRPTYPDFPYNVYTMIHAKSREACEQVAQAIAARTGLTDYAMLYSTREFKKVRLNLFIDAFDEWEHKHMVTAAD